MAQMESVLEVLNEGVIVTDDRHRTLIANSRFREMIGVSSYDFRNSNPRHFYSEKEWTFLMRQGELTC